MANNKAENIRPYNTEAGKTEQVEQMFDSIADKYDFLNHTLSLGIDKGWRKKGLKMLEGDKPQYILDIATGTGDLAIKANEILQPQQILGIDISEGMMDVARQKVEHLNLGERIKFEKQDCMALTLSNSSFDAAMVAFGVRNFANLKQSLAEIHRVLKPSGKLMILELTTPDKFPMKQLYKIYSKLVIPIMGKLISRSSEAYIYLPKTIEAFVQGEEMLQILLDSGFSTAIYRRYTFGICTMYLAEK